jgi:hypothetical protein
MHFCDWNYQWLPDGRLLVWIGEDSPRAQLLDPVTGKHDSLTLFNRLVISGCPPETGIRFFDLTPDGKSGVSFIGRFSGPDLFSRALSLDGYNMHIHTLSRQFAWTPEIAWEWSDGYRGWVTYGSFNNGRTARVMAVAHSELSHPEDPRIVEIKPSAMPGWTPIDVGDSAHLIGVTPSGLGVLAPWPDFLLAHPSWASQHGMPISLIDIDQGKQPSTDFEIHIPPGAQAESFILSPNTARIAWLFRYREPRAVPGLPNRYSTDEIWISDLNGGHMRQLAYQAAHFETTEGGLHFFAWKDNQTVSFILDNVLYTYPAGR